MDVRQGSQAIASSSGTCKNYYLLGYGIQKSFSPLLHNTGFHELRLPHKYGLFETPEVNAGVEALLQDQSLGGLSVTAPHKLQIPRLLDTVSEDARTMGSVNTVVVKQSASGERILHGENTDWEGISRCIVRGRVPISSETVGAVIGAGGAARAAVFALVKLGISPIHVINRTRKRAEDLAATFPKHDIQTHTSVNALLDSTNSPISVVVGCVPADTLEETDVPSKLFTCSSDGVLVEMAYHSQSTLITVARGCSGWNVFDGVDVLQQQAFGQFSLWTGLPAPEAVMTQAVNSALGRPINPLLL